MFDRLARTLNDLSSTFHRSDSHIFTRPNGALSQIGSGVNRMQRHEVGRRFAGALRGAGSSSTRAFADIANTAAYVVFAPSIVGLGF